MVHQASRNQNVNEKRIHETFGLLGNNLMLLGVTVIADRLQEGVPETIVA